jgi:hypothetical protein
MHSRGVQMSMINCLRSSGVDRREPGGSRPRRSPVNLLRPFRHDDAIARGALTRHHVVDGSYVLLFPGVSVDATTTVTMAVRAAGAALARPGGVVAGGAAAALWQVDPASSDTAVDLIVGTGGMRSCAGIRLRRVGLREDEVAVTRGLRVTTPARTAMDLVRWLPRGEAVVVIDALLRATGTEPAAVDAVVGEHPGERDVRRVAEVLAWVDPRSPSPRASRLRVALLARGVDVPLVAQRLLDGEGRLVAELALAWPAVRLGLAHTVGVRAAAARVGWEVREVREDLAEQWGTRAGPAPVDWLATRLRRPVARRGGPDGACDGGLSRLVPV